MLIVILDPIGHFPHKRKAWSDSLGDKLIHQEPTQRLNKCSVTIFYCAGQMVLDRKTNSDTMSKLALDEMISTAPSRKTRKRHSRELQLCRILDVQKLTSPFSVISRYELIYIFSAHPGAFHHIL